VNITSLFLNRNFQINCLAAAIILVLTFIFQYPYLFDYPSQIHAWAQTDRYALVLGFLNNNFNIFLPETFVFNHQFPASTGLISEKTITAVDFPIHEYLVALIMKFAGTTDVWIFLCYNIVFSMIGLLFLFKLSLRLTQSNILAFLVLIFVMTSPIYAYYQGGLLPTITSLSNVFIGIYFYTEYLFNQRSRNLNLSFFFITLAALSRSTFVIVFIAIAGLAFLKIFYHKGYLKKIWLPFVLATAFLVFNILYNSYLRKTYGSIFLSQLLHPSDWTHAKILLQNTWNNWKYDYFSPFHYWLFNIILLFAATAILLHHFGKKRITKNPAGFIHFVLVSCHSWIDG
jgi:hypothetical protein